MVNKKELRVKRYSSTDPEFYLLPATRAFNETKLKHERLCGDIYVAYELLGNAYWYVPQDYDAFGLKPDRQMIFEGKIVFWEIDRGTEDYFTEKGIKGKLDRYLQLSKSRPDKRFHVIFTTVYEKQSAIARCKGILNLINEYKRADQFMTAPHEWILKMPADPCFMTFSNPMGVSISAAK